MTPTGAGASHVRGGRAGRRPTWLVGAALLTIVVLLGTNSGIAPPSVAAAVTGDPVIGAAGDIACDPANSNFNGGNGTSQNCHQLATSQLLGGGLAAVLPLGDNQYYCGGLDAFLGSYDHDWGTVKSITRPAVGNHEYLTSGGTGCNSSNQGAAGHFGYFGAAAGTPGSGYYSYDIGTWHLIALNSNCGDAGGCSSTSPQGQWLAADLAAHQNVCTLAYWHIPLFSSGGRASSNSKAFWTQLYAAGADVILTGHDNIYERFARQTPTGVADPIAGIREFVVGTGGANHTSLASTFANSEVRNATTYGVLKMTLHPGSYDWQFVPEAGATFTDSGSETCVGAGSADLIPPTTPTGLAATATGPDRINLAWTASIDNVGVTGYRIWRDGAVLTSVSLSPTSFLDTGLQPGSTHTYTVDAFDAAGNHSPPSAPATATTTPGGTPTPTPAPAPTPSPGQTTTFTLAAAADAYVYESSPTTNYGTNAALRADGSPIMRSYLRFDLAAVSGTIVRATLRMYANSSQSTGLEAHRSTNVSWTESGVTYANAPPFDAPILGTSGQLTAGTWSSIDVSAAASGGGSVTLVLLTTSVTQVSLASGEAANWPQLVVQTTP